MRTYGQYCPIARATEVLAERWTLIILRNMLAGSTTFTQIADGAPGMSRTLLSTGLHELERVGVLERTPNPAGHGSCYHLTEVGRDLRGVMAALGTWGERWLELAPQHLDSGVVLHSWVNFYLAGDRLPQRRVVVQFDFPDMPAKRNRAWAIFDGADSEICRHHPGFAIDLFVEAEARAFAEWHLGRMEWADALRAGRIRVHGPRPLAQALPTWNQRSIAAQLRERGELGPAASRL